MIKVLEVDVEYPKRLRNFHNDLSFLPERIRIKKCRAHENFKTTIKSWINT